MQLLLGHTEALAVALGLVAAALAVKSFACERAGDQLDARPRMFADSSASSLLRSRARAWRHGNPVVRRLKFRLFVRGHTGVRERTLTKTLSKSTS